jgi:hypothetical protein
MIAIPRLLGLALLIAAPLAASATSVTEAGASFPTRMEAGDQELVLAGTGVSKYRVIFTVCAVGLYVPEGTPKDEILAADTPRHLEIEYFYDIPPEDIVRASMHVLREQLSDDELARQREALDRWHDAYQKVTDGDRYGMTYLPSDGTSLSLNGERLVSVPGAEFARTYFGIWLKPNDPLSKDLRRNLVKDLAAN